MILDMTRREWIVLIAGAAAVGAISFATQEWLREPKAVKAAGQNVVQIDKQYWECTSTHVRHWPKREGMLTRFGRTSDSPAFDSVECDQWSARFDQGCVSTNAWCQQQATKTRPNP